MSLEIYQWWFNIVWDNVCEIHLQIGWTAVFITTAIVIKKLVSLIRR